MVYQTMASGPCFALSDSIVDAHAQRVTLHLAKVATAIFCAEQNKPLCRSIAAVFTEVRHHHYNFPNITRSHPHMDILKPYQKHKSEYTRPRMDVRSWKRRIP